MALVYYVYILASKRHGTLYIGVTNNLVKRIRKHKDKVVDGFTKRYDITQLVYFESTPRIEDALKREKQLKEWKRQWKINLVEASNQEWKDLYEQIVE